MKIYLLAIALIFGGSASAQLVTTILDHNNTSVVVSNSGTLFNNGTAGYEVPEGSGNHALEGVRLWFAGKDSLGAIHINKGGIHGVGADVFNGAHSDSNDYGAAHLAKYSDGVWSICQWEIDQYRAWWLYDNGISSTPASPPNNFILQKINDWPAHGYVGTGEDYWMAPYYDSDNDGSYNPSQGDVPIIKGCCASWMVHNDSRGPHTLTQSNSLGIEIKTMVYQYKTWGTYLDDVTFIDYTISNMGSKDLTDFAYGLCVDATLGNPSDNYFGSDSTTNLMYFYNQDNNDENGYGVDPPVIGIVALKNNASSITKFTPNSTSQETWNVLNGLQPSGNVYMHPDGYPTKFEFSDDPNDPTGWSEYVLGNSTTSESGLISTYHGDLDSLLYATNTQGYHVPIQTYAILYADGGNHLENVQSLILQAAEIKQFYENDWTIPCEGAIWGIEENILNADIKVFPNPTQGQLTISNSEHIEMSVQVVNVAGQVVNSSPNSTASTIHMDLSSFSSGIYLVQINTNRGTITKKVIVE